MSAGIHGADVAAAEQKAHSDWDVAKQRAKQAKQTQQAEEAKLKSLKMTASDPAQIEAQVAKVNDAKIAYTEAESLATQAKDAYTTAKQNRKAYNNKVMSAGINSGLTDKDTSVEEFKKQFDEKKPEASTYTGKPDTESDSQTPSDQTSTDQTSTDQTSIEQSSTEQTQGSTEQGTDNNKQGSGQMAKDSVKNNFKFSDSFYRDIGAMVRGQSGGNLQDAKAITAKAQAQNARNEAATHGMEAQQHQQIANQNPYAEAGKMASVQNDAENRQNIQKAGVLGAGAALARKTNTPDVQAQMQREDQQRQQANERRDIQEVAQAENTAQEGDAQQWKLKSRDADIDRDEASSISMGETTQPEEVTETADTTQPVEKENTDTPTETEQPEPQQPAPEPEPPTETEKPQDEPPAPESAGTSWQNVMNYLTYGNDPTSGWSKGTKPGYAEAKQYADQQGWAPIQASQAEFDGDLSHLQEMVKAQQPGFYDAWTQGSGRIGEGGKQINRGDVGDEVIDNATTPSDARIKDLKQCLSDMRMKWIKEDWDRDGICSPEDFVWLLKQQKPYELNGRTYDPFKEEDWADDQDQTVLKGYANNIKNYVYSYKPEATQIDSSIDPNEEHIGPMAQDIEKVNPACIKETPEGVKTVDTARLAMMNAGAIGDLARQMQELSNKLNQLIGV